MGIALGFVLNKTYVAEENKSIAAIQLKIDTANETLHTTTDSLQRTQLIEQKKTWNKERSAIAAERDKK